MGSQDLYSGSLILKSVLLTICINQLFVLILASVNLKLSHLPYMHMLHTRYSEHNNMFESPCLGFLPPFSPDTSLLRRSPPPRITSLKYKPTNPKFTTQPPPLSGSHIPGHDLSALITLQPNIREPRDNSYTP